MKRSIFAIMRRDYLRLMLPSHKISISNSVFASRKLTSTENELSDENKVFTNQEKRLKMVEEIENLGMGEVQTSAAKKYLYSSLEDGNHSDRAYTDVQQYIDRIKAGNLPGMLKTFILNILLYRFVRLIKLLLHI